ncbi:MAG UNVERIFIED_CONTAM: hypothetical protein LVR18_35420 [Planctomycetaceae bacterium]|jgi:hypothetical protein
MSTAAATARPNTVRCTGARCTTPLRSVPRSGYISGRTVQSPANQDRCQYTPPAPPRLTRDTCSFAASCSPHTAGQLAPRSLTPQLTQRQSPQPPAEQNLSAPTRRHQTAGTMPKAKIGCFHEFSAEQAARTTNFPGCQRGDRPVVSLTTACENPDPAQQVSDSRCHLRHKIKQHLQRMSSIGGRHRQRRTDPITQPASGPSR